MKINEFNLSEVSLKARAGSAAEKGAAGVSGAEKASAKMKARQEKMSADKAKTDTPADYSAKDKVTPTSGGAEVPTKPSVPAKKPTTTATTKKPDFSPKDKITPSYKGEPVPTKPTVPARAEPKPELTTKGETIPPEIAARLAKDAGAATGKSPSIRLSPNKLGKAMAATAAAGAGATYLLNKDKADVPDQRITQVPFVPSDNATLPSRPYPTDAKPTSTPPRATATSTPSKADVVPSPRADIKPAIDPNAPPRIAPSDDDRSMRKAPGPIDWEATAAREKLKGSRGLERSLAAATGPGPGYTSEPADRAELSKWYQRDGTGDLDTATNTAPETSAAPETKPQTRSIEPKAGPDYSGKDYQPGTVSTRSPDEIAWDTKNPYQSGKYPGPGWQDKEKEQGQKNWGAIKDFFGFGDKKETNESLNEYQDVYDIAKLSGALNVKEGNESRNMDISKMIMMLDEASKMADVKGKKHSGKYGTEYQGDDDEDDTSKKSDPAEKKGRGRPKKDSNVEAGKYKGADDAAAAVIGGKAPAGKSKLPSKKHTLKDWIDSTEEMISERAKNKYAIGMAAAKKQAGYGSKPAHDLPKKVITKGHEIAKKIKEGGEQLPSPPDEVHLPKKGSKNGPVDVYRKKTNETEQKTMSRAAKGHEKYGKEGMQALAKAGRDGASEKKLDTIRNKYDKYDDSAVKEDKMAVVKTNKPVGSRVADIGPGGKEYNVKTDKAWDQLKGGQKKLDVAPPKGKLDAKDFAALRSKKKVKEGINFNQMMRETHMSIEEMLMELQSHIEEYKTTGNMSEELRDALDLHKYSKKDSIMGETPMMATSMPVVEEPVAEGPFAWAAKQAKAQDKDVFKFGGETHPVTEGSIQGGDKSSELTGTWTADAPKKGQKDVPPPVPMDPVSPAEKSPAKSKPMKENADMDNQFESWANELDSLLNENITVNTTTGSDGNDSVTVTATEGNAAELLALLKNAGMGGMFGGEQDNDSSPYGAPMDGDNSGVEMVTVDGPDVIDGGDSVLELIKKMAGLGSAPQSSSDDYVDEVPADYADDMSHEPHGDDEEDYDYESDEEEEEEVDESYGQADEGNKFTGNLMKARAAGQEEADLDGDGDMEKVREGDDPMCNECGMNESSCGCDHVEENLESARPVEEAYANEPDEAMQDIEFMTRFISGGLNREKRDQTTLPYTNVKVNESKSKDMLYEWKKLSGIK